MTSKLFIKTPPLLWEQGVGWAEEAEGENWDNCNRITIKNILKDPENKINNPKKPPSLSECLLGLVLRVTYACKSLNSTFSYNFII